MSKDSYFYEMPFRTNYEKINVLMWSGALLGAESMGLVSDLPVLPFHYMAAVCGFMGMKSVPAAIRLSRLQKTLNGHDLEFITMDQLNDKCSKLSEPGLWLGMGFQWEQRHCQRAFEITKRDATQIAKLGEDGLVKKVIKKAFKIKNKSSIGSKWIHGIEPDEKVLELSDDKERVHTLIAGTTGSGKTRGFDLLINQKVRAGECVIIVDPKGDNEMRENARNACIRMGREDDFLQFHPAFPEDSVRFDPLKNFTRATEIASRIVDILTSDSGSDPFISFGWQAINNIAQGLVLTGLRPSLVNLRRYIENGTASLVTRTIVDYSRLVMKDFDEIASLYLDQIERESTDKKKANIAKKIYLEIVKNEYPSSELEGLLSTFTHDEAHFSKMVATLMPILNMLTSGELGKMLSPDTEDLSDERLITDSHKVINNKQVIYIGLDSLTDGKVAGAIGSMILSDLASVAGDRYNFNKENLAVNIFVDEAAEVINDPFIQCLNKGRGANFRLFIATQTIADFVVKLGSEDKATQVLANVNNIIALRTNDPKTQDYIAEQLPPTRVKYVMRTQGQNTHGDEPAMHGGNQGERLMEEEAPLFNGKMLALLPNLEFIAKTAGGDLLKGRLPILTN